MITSMASDDEYPIPGAYREVLFGSGPASNEQQLLNEVSPLRGIEPQLLNEVSPLRIASEVARAYRIGGMLTTGSTEVAAAFAYAYAARLDVKRVRLELEAKDIAKAPNRVIITAQVETREGDRRLEASGSNWAQAAFAVSAGTLGIGDIDSPEPTPSLLRLLAIDALARVPDNYNPQFLGGFRCWRDGTGSVVGFANGASRQRIGHALKRLLRSPPDAATVCMAVFGASFGPGPEEVERLGAELKRLEAL